MKKVKTQLEQIFSELNTKIEELNQERRKDGLFRIAKAKVTLLGQLSLLANERVSLVLSLALTADMDALLEMDHVVKTELETILKREGLLYDEDSYLIWIPEGTRYDELFDFTNVLVKSIDPESALVSKAVKAPQKNKQLIREAIASGKFSGLVERIEKNGGHLKYFAED